LFPQHNHHSFQLNPCLHLAVCTMYWLERIFYTERLISIQILFSRAGTRLPLTVWVRQILPFDYNIQSYNPSPCLVRSFRIVIIITYPGICISSSVLESSGLDSLMADTLWKYSQYRQYAYINYINTFGFTAVAILYNIIIQLCISFVYCFMFLTRRSVLWYLSRVRSTSL
jgi:hypothetical protein